MVEIVAQYPHLPIVSFSDMRAAIFNAEVRIKAGAFHPCFVNRGNPANEKQGLISATLAMADCLRSGNVFVFSRIPNELLMKEGERSMQLFNEGLIKLPFDKSLFFYQHPFGTYLSLVENDGFDGIRISTVIYLKPPGVKEGALLRDNVTHWVRSPVLELRATAAAETVQFYPEAVVHHFNVVQRDGKRIRTDLVTDLFRLDPEQIKETNPANGHNVWGEVETALVLATLLNTGGVPVEYVPRSEKLNAARIRRGKAEIPAFYRVNADDYVTALQNEKRASKGESAGGTHASPRIHMRRGHIRRLGEDRTTWVSDCIVGARDCASFVDGTIGRSHYQVGGDAA